jgi:hypothetical protein
MRGRDPVECPREPEIVEAVLVGGWPHAREQELTAHAAACSACRETAEVIVRLREEYETAGRAVQVPAAGQVWWRAAVRARLEAAHAAARPITWLHGIAGASAAGLGAAVLGVVWPSIRQALDWTGAQISNLDPQTAQLASLLAATVQRSLPLAIGIASCLLLVPVALYLALSDD